MRRRADGRADAALRPCTVELGLLSSTDGSARLRAGGTRVLASVHGPRPARGARLEDAARARFEVFVSPAAGAGGDARAAELTGLLRAALAPLLLLEAAPRCVVTLCVHVQADDGAAAAVAINASVLALADAGVPLRALAAAATVAAGADGRAVVDATADEAAPGAARALVTAAFAAAALDAPAGGGGGGGGDGGGDGDDDAGAPLAFLAAGGMRADELEALLADAAGAARHALAFTREALRARALRDAVNCAPEARAALGVK
jgi:exosome complex component RRP41